MGQSLNPPLISRVWQAVRPEWARTVRARKVAASALIVLAGLSAIRSNPHSDQTDVVVARHDIAPGTALSADDVSLESRVAHTVPDGATSDVATVLHATLTGPARRGEILTDVRLLSNRLTEAAAGTDARLVSVHPADDALIDLVRPGDVVDVVTGTDDGQGGPDAPRVLASGGIVVLVSDKHNRDDRVVLVALPATAAVAVAGATLSQAVTLTLR